MNCKFCNAELEEGLTLCPACGKENAEEVLQPAAEETPQEFTEEELEEAPRYFTEEELEEAAMAAVEEESVEEAKPVKVTPLWVKILAVVGAVALAAVLIGAVIFGIRGGGLKTKSYTVSENKAEKVKDTVVATVGDMELTNNALQVYYFQAVDDFYSAYGYYMDPSVLDFEKPLDEQIYDEETGTTWQEYFLESALTSWSRYAALNLKGREEGYVMSQEVVDYVASVPDQLNAMAQSNGYASAEEMLHSDMSAGCDMDGYMDFMNTNLYAGQYLESIYDSMVPTQEEIEAYYATNEAALNQQGIVNDGSITVDVRHILICPQGGTEDENGTVTYSDEEWETCRIKAQELLDKWQAEDGTEEGFAQYATDHTEDPGSMATGGLYTGVYVGQMVEPFEDWCFEDGRKHGDVGLVKTNYGYHIMYFVESHEVWIAKVSDTIIYERSLAIVNGAAEKWPLSVKYNKIALSEGTSDQ